MLTLGRVWTFGLIVVTFVFLPDENWDFWFVGSKQSYYSEFCLKNDKHCYILAKNLLSKEVRLGFKHIRRGFVQQIGSPGIREVGSGKTLPPQSYSLVEIDPETAATPIVHATSEGELLTPTNLILVTPVEEQKWFFLVFALLAAAATLTYSLLTYAREDERQEAKTTVSYSWHSQV